VVVSVLIAVIVVVVYLIVWAVRHGCKANNEVSTSSEAPTENQPNTNGILTSFKQDTTISHAKLTAVSR